MTVTAGTPIELVEGVYATLADRVAGGRQRFGRPLTLTEKILLNHLGDAGRTDRARRHLQRLPARPRRHAGRHRADGAAAVHDRRPAHHGRAVHRALRPPDLGQGGRTHRPGRRRRHQPRGLRLPPLGQRQVRHRLLGTRQRHHPPGRARELRLSRRHDDRHRQPHAERRRPGHGGHRRRRCRRGRRHDRLPVQRPLAEGHRRPADRHAVRVVVTEGRHPRGRPRPDRRGRHRRDHRVPRPGRRQHLGHRQGHHLQHGRRDRRHLQRVPLRPQHGDVPEGDGPRGDRRRGRQGRRPTCGPTTARCTTSWSRSTSTS